MSGLDEAWGIRPCPHCHKNRSFTYWMLKDSDNNNLGYLNYCRNAIKSNGEFNLGSRIEHVVLKAHSIVCSRCHSIYKRDTPIFERCMRAVIFNQRRGIEGAEY